MTHDNMTSITTVWKQQNDRQGSCSMAKANRMTVAERMVTAEYQQQYGSHQHHGSSRMTSTWKQQNDSNMTSTVFEFECSRKQEHDSMTAATSRWRQQQEEQQQCETNQFDTRYSHPKTCRACRLHSPRPILRGRS